MANEGVLKAGQGGRRVARKMTNKEISEEIIRLSTTQQGLIRAVSQDIDRLNVIMFATLNQLGFAEQIDCASCKQVIFRPKLEELKLEDICPSCGKSLEEDEVAEVATASSDSDSDEEE